LSHQRLTELRHAWTHWRELTWTRLSVHWRHPHWLAREWSRRLHHGRRQHVRSRNTRRLHRHHLRSVGLHLSGDG
jgi:hypothetical protein